MMEKELEKENISFGWVEKTLDNLNFKKLTRILSFIPVWRKILVKSWIKELKKGLDLDVKLEIVREETTPFMQENGVLCFCKKDLKRAKRLFMLLSHETAHFVLIKSEGYEKLKERDRENGENKGKNPNMLSPVEYVANLITIMILDKCWTVARGRKAKDEISQITQSLKKTVDIGNKIIYNYCVA